MTSMLDVEVALRVPAAVAHVSGAADWSDSTRQSFLTDLEHPATLEVIRADSGHNPRGEDPSSWKPGSPSRWCAYAVDWVAVKHRWDLSVTAAEMVALADMIDTCDLATSSGADPATVLVNPVSVPTIERIAEPGE